jgi:hypothetical protein
MKLNYRSLLAAVISASLAIPGAALADRREEHGHRSGHDYGYNQAPRYERHEEHGRWSDHGYGYSHAPRYEQHDYRVYRDRDGDRLLLGLVVGGILGYAINNAQQGSAGYDRYPAPRAYDNTYAVPQTYSDSSCLQEREYTTVVQVGGRSVDAYGTACLQPDGSWKRGPAQLVSY